MPSMLFMPSQSALFSLQMALQNSFFLCILITILFLNLFFAKGACFQPSGSVHEEEEEVEDFNGGSSIFSVEEFGAKGDGSFDNRVDRH